MRAGAAGTLRALQAARLERKPPDPVVVLLGDAEARKTVRECLGAETRMSADGVTAHMLRGLVLVEPADLLGAAEVTELATFLRGLQEAHALLLCDADPEPDGLAEIGPMLASFYGLSGRQLLDFLVVAKPRDRPLNQTLSRYHLEEECPDDGTVFHFDMDAEAVPGLLGELRRRAPRSCEPLRCLSPLLSQYRGIRQQLGTRKPSLRCTSPLSSVSAQEEEFQAGRTWTVLVFGKTGAGKSHLANLLLGADCLR
ncbi:unnamed protein product, partial [Effrenium voratum]